VLSPVIGLSCHRHSRDRFRQLDVSVETSGPHDFAVRCIVTRQLTMQASIASRTANRDDREAPLSSGTEWRELLKMICPTGRAKYFCAKEWTVESALI
jgi:hypothetical protein